MLIPTTRQERLPAGPLGDLFRPDGLPDLFEFKEDELVVLVPVAVILDEEILGFLLAADRHQESGRLGHELNGDEDLSRVSCDHHQRLSSRRPVHHDTHIKSHRDLHDVRNPPTPRRGDVAGPKDGKVGNDVTEDIVRVPRMRHGDSVSRVSDLLYDGERGQEERSQAESDDGSSRDEHCVRPSVKDPSQWPGRRSALTGITVDTGKSGQTTDDRPDQQGVRVDYRPGLIEFSLDENRARRTTDDRRRPPTHIESPTSSHTCHRSSK